jgi:hypothetical protein
MRTPNVIRNLCQEISRSGYHLEDLCTDWRVILTLEMLNLSQIIYTNSVRTSQETHCVTTTEPNQLMLFKETVTVYCGNHMKHTNTICGQNVEF